MNLPVLHQHGTRDPMIPVARARASREALLKLGVGLSYREHEMEHGLSPAALRDLVGWLEDRVWTPVRLV